MSKKISKSDTTPAMEKRDEYYRVSLSEKKSRHFAENTWILQDNRRGLILAVMGEALCIRWEDGTVSTTYPIALRR